MTIFRVQVFYRRAVDEKWTNVYHLSAADLTAAAEGFSITMSPALQSLLDSSCTLVKALVSDPETLDFTEVPVDSVGTSSASGDLLPLFNSMKARFQPIGFGRPDVKFYKGFITESIQTQGFIPDATVTFAEGVLSDMMADLTTGGTPAVSENGDVWGGVSVQHAVQMRQMHRRRKKATPPA